MTFRPRIAVLVCLLGLSPGTQAHWADAIAPVVDEFASETSKNDTSSPTETASPVGKMVVSAPPGWLEERVAIDGDSHQQDGDYRGELGLAASDLTGLNDALALNYRRSLARSDAQTRGFGFDYSFPWRAGTIRVYGNMHEYERSAMNSERKYQVSGNNRAVNFSANRTLLSTDNTVFGAVLGLGTRDSEYFVEGDRNDDASRRFSTLRVEGRLRQYLALDTTATTSLMAERGLEMFGADGDEQWSGEQRTEYRKYIFQSKLSKELWRWHYDLNGRYQFTPDILPGSQHVLAFSSGMMHGFAGQSLGASQGGWLRMNANSPWSPIFYVPGFRANLQLSVLKGWIPEDEVNQSRHGSASAAELGFNLRGDGLSAGFRVGTLLAASDDAAHRPDVPDMSLSLSFDL
ncbi:ShlB/FhaC/HecB family hemolysin secretion/activation protein [Marinobacter salicampi]|uniref:ShlB/FhaC/HecB family hemolysin secretion/activation protein n=1 Tax=Marinobacter salicampi TaxID=435907 RepID=UPI00140E4B53|nr:ShlB/FhaC/HecB family hemolysin secretion/activation protein [Marinobacter salicampi]